MARLANAGGLWSSYVAVIVASFLWGSLYPAGKPAVAAVGPMQVAFCRVALAFLTRAPSVFTIPKAAASAHVADNAAAGALTLSESEIATLDKAFPRGPKPSSLPML